MKRRDMLLVVLVEVAAVFYILNRDELPTLGLALQRGSMIFCQQAARTFGNAALKLEASYRVKVAP